MPRGYHPTMDDGTPISLIQEILFEDALLNKQSGKQSGKQNYDNEQKNYGDDRKDHKDEHKDRKDVHKKEHKDVHKDVHKKDHKDEHKNVHKKKQQFSTEDIHENAQEKRNRLSIVQSIVYAVVFTILSFIGFYITPYLRKTKQFMSTQTNFIVSLFIGILLSTVVKIMK